jgi:hypothetical protein
MELRDGERAKKQLPPGGAPRKITGERPIPPCPFSLSCAAASVVLAFFALLSKRIYLKKERLAFLSLTLIVLPLRAPGPTAGVDGLRTSACPRGGPPAFGRHCAPAYGLPPPPPAGWHPLSPLPLSPASAGASALSVK